MPVDDFIVPPRNWDSIASIAKGVRAQFGLDQEPSFPIIDFIERILDQELEWLQFEVGTSEEMGMAEGYTCPNGSFIQLREDVYKGACQLIGRHRFTAAHELGHFAMHTSVPLARATSAEKIPPYRLAEPQANHFAAELLMPAEFIRRSDTARALANRFNVSHDAACRRLEYLIRKNKI